MHIRNAASIVPVGSPHGEIVYELLGLSAGGSQGHSVAQIVIPPGSASRRHLHPVAEESYTILSGMARLELDEATASLGPGDCVAILPGQIHQIANAGDDDLVLLAVCVPAWTPDNSVFLD